MMETIWWFILKDSRVVFTTVRRYTTQVLIAIALAHTILSFNFIKTVDSRIFASSIGCLIYYKFVLELVFCFAVLPFLILKAAQRHIFDPYRRLDRFKIKLHLQSRL